MVMWVNEFGYFAQLADRSLSMTLFSNNFMTSGIISEESLPQISFNLLSKFTYGKFWKQKLNH